MPILVSKTYLCDTDSMDEAYDMTKPTNDKVETFQVGQMRPYSPATAQPQQVPTVPPNPPLTPIQEPPK